MAEDERAALIMFVAANPQAGDVMPGAGGGARKLRFRRPGKGKSGGNSIFFYCAGENVPLFLLNVLTKGDRANLTKAEQNELSGLLSQIVGGYSKGHDP